MVIENWVLVWFIDEGQLSSLSVLRLVRLCRIARLIRLIPELGVMVKSMFAAARSVSSSMLLQLGIMYVFAIIFTKWGKEKDVGRGRFVGNRVLRQSTRIGLDMSGTQIRSDERNHICCDSCPRSLRPQSINQRYDRRKNKELYPGRNSFSHGFPVLHR